MSKDSLGAARSRDSGQRCDSNIEFPSTTSTVLRSSSQRLADLLGAILSPDAAASTNTASHSPHPSPSAPVDEGGTIECLLEDLVGGAALSSAKKLFRVRHATPESSQVDYIALGVEWSPMVKNFKADAAVTAKEDRDTPFKMSTWGEITLAQTDKRMIQMSPDDFKRLIPGKDMSDKQLRRARDFSSIDKLESKLEAAKYNPLCDIFNIIEELAGSANRWRNISALPESSTVDHRPDMGSYDKIEPDAVFACENGVKKLAEDPHVARTAWAWMVSFVEVKNEESLSGFHFRPRRDESGKQLFLNNDTEVAKAARAQFVKYTTEALLRTHRTHYYAFYISGMLVRVFRWDRNGCFVSEPIDLRKDYRVFLNILYRIAKSNDWGFDETISLATPEDMALLENFEHENDYMQLFKYLMLDHRIYDPIVKLSCPTVSMDGSEPEGIPRTYLIGRHLAGHYAPIGRCTKGYVAFEVETRRMVFLKDQWRCVTRERTELETYRRLHQCGVKYLATPVAGGDIDHHRTISQDFMTHLPEHQRPTERVHTRLVTEEIGHPLEAYKDSVELLQIIMHAIIAHRQAWERAKVLHRDVSPDNILIDIFTRKGILNDWDLSKYDEDLKAGLGACEPAGISGTWGTKSSRALRYPKKPPEVSDDMESFIYVVLFLAFRFHHHKNTPARGRNEQEQATINAENKTLVTRVNHYFFEEDRTDNGFSTGGELKFESINNAKPPIKLRLRDGRPQFLEIFLGRAFKLMQDHYVAVPESRYAAYAVNDEDERAPVDEGSTRRSNRKLISDPAFDEYNEMDPEWSQLPDSRLQQEQPPVPPPPAAQGRRILDHSNLFKLIKGMFYDEEGREHDLSIYRGDKLFDHLDNVRVETYVRRKTRQGAANALLDDLDSGDKDGRRIEEEGPDGDNATLRRAVLLRGRKPEKKKRKRAVVEEEAAELEVVPRAVPARRMTRARAAQAAALPVLEDVTEPARPTRSKRLRQAAPEPMPKRQRTTSAPMTTTEAGPSRTAATTTLAQGRAIRQTTSRKGSGATAKPAAKSATAKTALKATTSTKAAATRKPSSSRRADAVKGEVTRKTKVTSAAKATARKPAAPRKAEVPEHAPPRRSARLARRRTDGV